MKGRRSKGEGSVYRREDGRMVGEYEDARGKRRYVFGLLAIVPSRFTYCATAFCVSSLRTGSWIAAAETHR